MSTARSSPRLVGRRPELARLAGALDAAAAGRASAVVVSGESGVGKSRLVREFLEEAGRAGAQALVGGCVDLSDAAPPYWPLVQALRGFLRTLDGAALADLGARHPLELARVVPETAAGDGVLAEVNKSGTAKGRFFEFVLNTLERLSERSPVVLVVEDLHWADQSTRDLLAFLLANLGECRVATVLTHRSDAVGDLALQGFLADLRRRRQADVVELAPLDREELDVLVAEMLGGPPSPDVADAIWDRAEGNPFFAEELLAALPDGSLATLPATLQQILLVRVAVLSERAQGVLRLMAVGGNLVAHPLLAAVAGVPDRELLDGVRECVTHRVLVADESATAYAFRHSLMREAVASDLLPGERAAFHAAYARALADHPELATGSATALLAHHWYAAGDAQRALHAAVAAGAEAATAHGYAEARSHYERALDLWARVAPGDRPTGIDELELSARAAEATHLSGDPRRAARLLRAALAAPSPPGCEPTRVALAEERLGRYLWASGDGEEALRAYERAAALVPADATTRERARVLAAHADALMLSGRYSESRRLAEEALGVARVAGARAEEAAVLSTLGFDLAFLGELDESLSLLRRAQAIAEEVGALEEVARAHLNHAELLSGPLNRLEEAVAVARQGAERVRQLGLERTYGISLLAIAVNTLFRLGRWDEAEALLSDALRPKATGAVAVDLLLARAKLAVGRGDVDGARQDFARIEEVCHRSLDTRVHLPLLTLKAGLALWEGDFDGARAAVEHGIQRVVDTEDTWFLAPLVWHGLRAEGDRAEVAGARGDRQELEATRRTAARLVDLARSLPHRCERAVVAVREAVGAYAELCEAEWTRVEGRGDAEAWRRVAERWQELLHPYPAAYAAWREAEALLSARTRNARATSVLRSAHAVAVQLGAEPFRRQVASLAQRARIDLDLAQSPPAAADEEPSRTPPTSPAPAPAPALVSLTRREREVLALVAQGRSNREVANALFISEKTASVHVSHILAKLGVRTRVQATVLAHQAGAARAP